MTLKSSSLSSPLSSMGDMKKYFQIVKSIPLADIACQLVECEHLATGAKIIHIQAQDVENVFCLSFKTYPPSSNGVAHILEHTVLCGSERFPVKDPFFSMARRSLNTFMNAFTGSDFTCYPAASQVPQDFYNLLDVYLDSVFFPRLDPLSFLQEGWRYDFSEDPEEKLVYKGIVFNEMKGVWSSPDARLWYHIHKSILPDQIYSFDSGGRPLDIPKLSYEEFVQFHRQFYHPGHCLFYFYGNLPLEDHLSFVQDKVLNKFSKPAPLPSLSKQSRFLEEKTVQEFYPVDHVEAGREYMALSFLCGDVLEQEEALALCILDIALCATDAAPLKKAFLDSGLSKQFQSYLEDDHKEVLWVFIAKACQKEDLEKVRTLFYETIEQLVDQGLNTKALEAALHQVELYRRETSSDSYPFGLNLFLRAGLLYQHGGQFEDALALDELFSRMQKYVKEPSYFHDLLRKYILNNKHSSLVQLSPCDQLQEKEAQEELVQLESKEKNLSEKDKEDIRNQAKKLASLQEEKQDVDSLPKLSLKDIPERGPDFSLTQEEYHSCQVYHHPCSTNGMVYVDYVCDLPHLSLEELPYVQFFRSILTQMACAERSYEENLQKMVLYTGGIEADIMFHPQAQSPQLKPSFQLSAKALVRNQKELFSLMKDLLLEVQLHDVERLRQLVKKQENALSQGLVRNSMRYASLLASRHVSLVSHYKHALSGLGYYEFIQDLHKNFDEKLPGLLEKLDSLQERILSFHHSHLIISCEDQVYKDLKSHAFYRFL